MSARRPARGDFHEKGKEPSAVSAPAQTLVDLLRQVQKAIKEAPPEAWDDETRDAGRTVEGSLSARLRELDEEDRLREQLRNLVGAVPCVHPGCLYLVALIDDVREHVVPGTGEPIGAEIDLPGSYPNTHAAAPEGSERRL